MGLPYGRAGRSTAKNGGFRPGQAPWNGPLAYGPGNNSHGQKIDKAGLDEGLLSLSPLFSFVWRIPIGKNK
jgi:hypothetical protein